MRITSNGQIPLPPEIMDQLGFMPDTEIEYKIEGDTLLLRKNVRLDKGSDLISLMKGTANIDLTTDQIMDMTRKKSRNLPFFGICALPAALKNKITK